MALTTVIVVDNGVSAQDQDYLPGRFLLQKEISETLITQVFETDGEGYVGIIPVAQPFKNDLMTPSRNRAHLSSFLHSCELRRVPDLALSLFQAEHSFDTKNHKEKTLIIFLCSEVVNADEAITNMFTIAMKGIETRVICFGDAIEFGGYLKKEITFDNFRCLTITPDQDFISAVNSFLSIGVETYDPDLQEAIRRSMMEN